MSDTFLVLLKEYEDIESIVRKYIYTFNSEEELDIFKLMYLKTISTKKYKVTVEEVK